MKLAPLCQASILAAAVAIAFFVAVVARVGFAQPAPIPAILNDGDAVVTGFSGPQPPTLIAPGADPADKTYINVAGPSARVVDLQAPGGPPQAQLLQAPKPFSVTASQVGQVFAVALDNASRPNIYLAATSAYGLPIVVPDTDGDGVPDRVKQGTANASFMPGLFGPADRGGGPGSIWRIDGTTGEVGLFANVMLDGVANSGPALGGLAFDAASNSLFVADRNTGMIHAFDMSGAERGHYDHGTQGRQAAGLPPVPFDPANRLNITEPGFKTDDPTTWDYAPPERLISGLAVHAGRLFYAVADKLQIWSVGIAPDGSFGSDPRLEITVPPAASATEISKITFDDQGRMLLGERAAPTGAYDFATLAQEGVGRVLRYAPAAAEEPGAPAWQPEPDQYAIGFPLQMTNGNGGVAIGYGYDPAGQLDHNSCGGFLWSTGEQLRVSANPEVAAQLAQGGSAIVNGLQGNGVDIVRPANVPPQQTYFVDYDDRFEDANARGHVGDVAIWRICAAPSGMPAPPAPGPEIVPPGPEEVPGPAPEEEVPGPGPEEEGEWWDEGPPPPPPLCPPGMHLATNALQCCPLGQIPGFTGGCQPICPDGAADLACWHGFQPGLGPAGAFAGICWNGTAPVKMPPAACAVVNTLGCNKCPKSPLKNCPAGFNLLTAPPGVPTPAWLWSNATCVASPAQAACAPGTTFCAVWGTCATGSQVGLDGACHPDICPAGQTAFPVNRCCLNGTAPDAHGNCPGILVLPLWYLDYLATGTGPCVPPNCSYYEFTITGRQSFGRGSLTQRITLPPGSDFPEARVTRGSKYCPASRWSCSKAGNVFTCSAEDCGLAPGDQVVVRLEGKVAPELTEPPPMTIEKTACGVLEWQPMTGRGRAVVEQPAAPSAKEGQQGPTEGGGVKQLGARPTKKACWTIRIIGKPPIVPPPPCSPNYVATADGQCCLRSQMTAGGVCCPAGQQPDARRSACIPVCTGDRIWTGTACACPPGTVERRGQCVRRVEVAPQPCPSDSVGTPPNCRCRSPLVGTPGSCTQPAIRRCPEDSVGTPPNCHCRRPLVGTPGSCTRPEIRRCPSDSVGTPPNCHCRRPLVGTPGTCTRPAIRHCPEGQVGRPPHCRPARGRVCPTGQHWNGKQCVLNLQRFRPRPRSFRPQ